MGSNVLIKQKSSLNQGAVIPVSEISQHQESKKRQEPWEPQGTQQVAWAFLLSSTTIQCDSSKHYFSVADPWESLIAKGDRVIQNCCEVGNFLKSNRKSVNP